MLPKIAWLLLFSGILHLTQSSNIQRIPASPDSENSISSDVSSEEISDAKLEEVKKNLTTGLEPHVALLVGSVLDKLKNDTSDTDKLHGIFQLLFVPTIIKLADNQTVIDTLTDTFGINNDTNTISAKP